MAYKQGINRNQMILLPQVVDDYVTDNNQVRFIEVFIDSLDLQDLGFFYAGRENKKLKGHPAYNPADMLKLFVYGYLNKIRSSRNLEQETKRNLELMWLVRKLSPDFKTIADFRKNNASKIKKVFKEFVNLCKSLDLYGKELVSIDGSKFKALNSRKNNFTKKKLDKMNTELDETIEKYMHDLEENDKKEDKIKVPTAEELKRKIEKLKVKKENLKDLKKQMEENNQSQISLTDPESRLMKDVQKMDVCYNVQTTVDSKYKLLVDYEPTNDTDDHFMLAKMSKQAKEILSTVNKAL
jgi:transposase